MRVLGAEHLTGVQVGDHPAVRVDALGEGGGTVGRHQPAGVQALAAHGAAVGGVALGRPAVGRRGGGGGGRVHGGPGGVLGEGGRGAGQQDETRDQSHRGRTGTGQQGSHGGGR